MERKEMWFLVYYVIPFQILPPQKICAVCMLCEVWISHCCSRWSWQKNWWFLGLFFCVFCFFWAMKNFVFDVMIGSIPLRVVQWFSFFFFWLLFLPLVAIRLYWWITYFLDLLNCVCYGRHSKNHLILPILLSTPYMGRFLSSFRSNEQCYPLWRRLYKGRMLTVVIWRIGWHRKFHSLQLFRLLGKGG